MDDLLIEYDDLMTGQRKSFSDRFFGRDESLNEKRAVRVMRYAFAYYLGWKPDILMHYIDKNVLECLKLTSLVHYVKFPGDYDPQKDFFYLVSLAYPSKRIPLSEQILHTYTKVLNGELAKYPKDYFMGEDGLVRAGICLQFAINQDYPEASLNDLYFYFASSKATTMLKDWKLHSICKQAFNDPVEFLHFSLPADRKNALYFEYYRYLWYQSMTTDNGRRRKIDHKKLIYGPLD